MPENLEPREPYRAEALADLPDQARAVAAEASVR